MARCSSTSPRSRGNPCRWKPAPLPCSMPEASSAAVRFSTAVLAAGKYALGLGLDQLRTLAFTVLILGGQATIFAIRERRWFWRSRPSGWLLASAALTFAIVAILALGHIFMAPLPLGVAAAVLVASLAFGLAIDAVKLVLFRRFAPA